MQEPNGKENAMEKEELTSAMNDAIGSEAHELRWEGDEAHLTDGEHSVFVGYYHEGDNLVDRIPMCERALENWQE
jgi:hypothetical protein